MDYPNYYYVAPHSTALNSILYSLYLLNIPSSDWHNIYNSFMAYKKIYKYTGLTISNDNNIDSFKQYLNRDVPSFIVLRDPVDSISTQLNILLKNAIFRSIDQKNYTLISNFFKDIGQSVRRHTDTSKAGYGHYTYYRYLTEITSRNKFYFYDYNYIEQDNSFNILNDIYQVLLNRRIEDDFDNISELKSKFIIRYGEFTTRMKFNRTPLRIYENNRTISMYINNDKDIASFITFIHNSRNVFYGKNLSS